MYPEQFLEFLKKERSLAILRTKFGEAAADAMNAAMLGGFRIIEFTLTIPGAFDLIRQFSKSGELAVGAGTVLTVADARKSVEAGACFLASPVLDPQIVAAARELNVAVIPGTHTATEMWQAHQMGAPLQKLFPAAAGGPQYVRSILAPMPFLRIVPTNGVDGSNAAEYLKAGAYAVGVNAAIFSEDLIASNRFEVIEEKARQLRADIFRES